MTARLTHWYRLPLALLIFITTSVVAQEDASVELSEQEQQELDYYQSVLESLEPQTGIIELGNGLATLTVPEDFYFLDSADAEKVLVDLWGNVPGQNVLGMLFPAKYSPVDYESWAVTIDYVEDGFVSDEDATDIDYDELLSDIQKDTRAANKDRIDAGYESVDLIGWAEAPHYNAVSKKLYWAKELRFGGMDETTLNYEIRALGRRGILSMTFIAATDQLAEINESREQVLAMAEFNDGNRYVDFDPSIDKVAAYGIGALVAGKIAAKTGLLAALLIFLKKFGVFIVLGIGAFSKKIVGVFRTDKLEPPSA